MDGASRLFFCPAGPAAAAALQDYVRAIQGADPLAPVTVVGPSTYANLGLRRELGHGGLANVGFVHPHRLADLLGGPLLAAQDLRPLTGLVESQALRQAVSQTDGLLREKGYHPATHRTLQTAIRELAQLTLAEKAAWQGRGSDLSREVLRIEDAYRKITADYYTEAEDLAQAAAAAVKAGGRGNALADLGFVIFFHLRRITAGQQELIAALAAAGQCAVFLPLVGDADGDRMARETAEKLADALGPAAVYADVQPDDGALAGRNSLSKTDNQPPADRATNTRLLVAQDAHQEIRWVIRNIFRQLENGTPLRRIAILYRQSFPYGALIPEELALAGLPAAGPNTTPLAQTGPGRTLTGLINLAQGVRAGQGRELPREEVTAWLTSCPVRFPGGLAGDFNPSQWDNLSKQAGIVRGLEQWRDNLNRLASDRARQAERLAAQGEVSEARAAAMAAEGIAAGQLRRFITGLAAALTPPAEGSSWGEFAKWAEELFARYGADATLSAVEAENRQRIGEVVRSLAELEQLAGGGIDFDRFRETLEEALTGTPGRLGATGQGVFVAPLGQAAGMSFDAVHLVGLVEGAFPPPLRESPLLPEREQPAEISPNWRLSRSERLAEERHNFMAALAAAPLQTLSYPIADAGGSRANYPSRWFLEQATRLEGTAVRSSTLKSLLNQRDWLTAIGSPEQEFGSIAGLAAADQHDYDLASLWNCRERYESIRQHPLAKAGILAGALQVGRGRYYSSDFSEWNGNLAAAAGSAGLAGGLSGQVLSPTGLEKWASCPFRYFLGQQLRLSAQDSPEDIYRISSLEQGSLVHEILEKFIGQAREQGTLPLPGQEWTAADEKLLRDIAEKAFAEAESRGITGRPLLWRMAQADILDDLTAFLDSDTQVRERFGLSPAREEARFGIDGDNAAAGWAAAVYRLRDGTEIRFRGVIDRVDRSADGREALVLDYKSGSTWGYAGLEEDAIDKGRRLQLSIYGLAAQQALGPDALVRAAYWFVSSRGGFQLIPSDPVNIADETVQERFEEGIAAIVSGIRGGVFPANPGSWAFNNALGKSNYQNCHYCDFDALCPARRGNLWERLKGRRQNLGALAGYLELAEEAAGE